MKSWWEMSLMDYLKVYCDKMGITVAEFYMDLMTKEQFLKHNFPTIYYYIDKERWHI